MAKKKIPSIVKEIQKYEIPEINWGTKKLISYSQYSIFHNCPKRWSLHYREGHKMFTSTIHTVFGTALHEAVQYYLNIMYNQSGAAADREDILGIFEKSLKEEYKKQYKANNNKHFSDAGELGEFYNDGVKIIEFLKKKRNKYFSKRGWYLVGCEIPIHVTPYKKYPNVVYRGYLDVVLYNEVLDKFYILDIKTSTRGWNKNVKSNELKQFQLILYKKFFSDQFNIPLNKIEIEFFITKRKIFEDSEYPIPRIQTFKPSSGKIKLKKAEESLKEFIEKAFTPSGFTNEKLDPQPSKWNCRFCPYSESPDLCPEGVKFLKS